MTDAVSAVFATFPWPDPGPVDALRTRLPPSCAFRVFRAIEGGEGCVHVEIPVGLRDTSPLEAAMRDTLPGATLSRLALLMDLAGASAGEAAPYHYIVETDVRAESEADLNAWYDREHLAGLASVPGTVRAMRFRNIGGHPRYHAFYDLTRPEVLGCPAWLAVRGSAWSDRVRPAFFNTRRTMFQLVGLR